MEQAAEYYAKRDLAAQESMAKSTESLVRISEAQNEITSTGNWLLAFTLLATLAAAIAAVIAARAAQGSVAQAQRQADTMEKNERAYVFAGGPHRMLIPPSDRPSKLQYMVIQNHGKTIGFITSVEWALCPASKFPRAEKVSRIIDENLLPDIEITKITEAVDNLLRPSDVHKIYGRVGFGNESRGHVFFGRIKYKNLFSDRTRYSTFKLELFHDRDGSMPLPGCYSEDWD